MAPSGRSRKPRLMRIDAAIDAMTSFGFSEEIVRKTVKELLKEYGGDEGWRFIEDNSYIELIEAILRSVERNNQEKGAQDENHTKDAPAEASFVATNSIQVTETADIALLDAVGSSSVAQLSRAKEFGDKGNGNGSGNGSGRGWKDQNSEYKEIGVMGHPRSSSIPCSPPAFPFPPPVTSLPTGRHRLPCFGWLESEDEDDPNDFEFFDEQVESTPKLRPDLSEDIKNGTDSNGNCKSRWDEILCDL